MNIKQCKQTLSTFKKNSIKAVVIILFITTTVTVDSISSMWSLSCRIRGLFGKDIFFSCSWRSLISVFSTSYP